MIKNSYLLLIVLFSTFCFSQHKSSDTLKSAFIPIKLYKEIYKKSLTKKDSLSFMFRDGDTLVKVQSQVKPKGISVPYEFKDSTFLYYYKKVAFNHKKDSFSMNTSMKYWKDDIKIFFSTSVSKKVKKEFMSFAVEITNQVDSLKISEVKKVEKSNYIIYYFGDYDYESRMTNYKNSDYYMYWKENKIYRNTIKLDSKLYFKESLKISKLKEFFIQSLGYFKFIDDFECTSYFSNCYSENKKLSKLDLELIKYHYSYGICKGTNLETFEEQHVKAKKALKINNIRVNFIHSE